MNSLSPVSLLMVASGAVLGALLRYGTNIAALNWLPPRFPWATMLVNIFGCFAAGAALALVTRGLLSEQGRLFWMVGMLGALTTFSAFSVETLAMLQNGAYGRALLNIGLNVAGSLVAVIIGFWLVHDVLA